MYYTRKKKQQYSLDEDSSDEDRTTKGGPDLVLRVNPLRKSSPATKERTLGSPIGNNIPPTSTSPSPITRYLQSLRGELNAQVYSETLNTLQYKLLC